MQRTVGPCHRDRKQKRNEKSEEKRDTTAGGGEKRKGSRGGAEGVPPGGAPVRGGLRGRGRQGTWLWEEVERDLPRPQLVHRGQRAGRESPGAGKGRPQEHRRPGKGLCTKCLEPA